MPYIDQQSRVRCEEGVLADAGHLNYQTHQLIDTFFTQHGRRYDTFNAVMGVLECVKQELYRRMIADYEQIKMRQNGDCAPYTTWIQDYHQLNKQ